ncbi:MAG: Gfo/Idh/MocA family oxidoreductase, partial [Crenarchaeota archaeon]|nr:Gfo/Idh/MocA family oxidoreductase [Thermoproteota archaeon]
VVNNNLEQAKKVLQQISLNCVPVVHDLQIALSTYPVDIVWIVSPNSLHGPQSLLALEAGKHVFCEKPPAVSFADFSKQIEISDKNPSLRTMVDYILYFNPMEQALHTLAAEEFFGTIHQIQINYRHQVNIADDKAWKLKKEFMGDALGMGINHAISVMIGIMSVQTNPISVYATSHNSQIRAFEPDPVWNVMIRFQNGATGVCQGNIDIENGYDLYHNIAGSKGGFIFDSRVKFADKIRLWNETTTDGEWVYPLRNVVNAEDKHLKLFTPDMMLPDSGNVMDHQVGRAVEHFIESVRSDRDSPLSFSQSRLIGEIGWAAQISAKYHREVGLPLSESDKKIALEL